MNLIYMLSTIITIVQLVIGVLLMVAILLQQKSAGIGAAFGGASGVYTSRRGIDRVLYNITIALSILFFALALVNLILA